MAGGKRGKNKKPAVVANKTQAPSQNKENTFPRIEKAPSRVVSPLPDTTNYTELQNDEIVYLESAYGENFKQVVDAKPTAWKKSEPTFEVRLISRTDSDFALTVHVVFTATYPRSVPIITLKDHETLRPAALFKVQKYIETEPRKHITEDIPMTIILEGIDEILDTAAVAKKRGNERSLEEERAEHEAVLANQAALKRQQEQADQAKLQEEETQLWTRQLEKERRWETELAIKTKRERQSTITQLLQESALESSARAPSQSGIAELKFDQTCTVKDAAGNVSTFKDVTEKTRFKDGAVSGSKLYRVRPILTTGRVVPALVLKQVTLRCVGKTVSQARDTMENLETKLIKLQQLSHHRIVSVFAYKIEQSPISHSHPTWDISVLMPHAERGSLEEILELTGAMNIVKVRTWTRDLLDALSYIHNRGIVHLDIHPRNILLFMDERTGEVGLKLSDCGFQYEFHAIARDSQPNSVSSLHSISQRPIHWRSPEVRDNPTAVLTQKTDVWDFGIVFLQMIFGPDVQSRYQSPDALIRTLDLSPPMREIVSRIFKSDVQKRSRAFELSSSEFLATDASVLANGQFSMPYAPFQHGMQGISTFPNSFAESLPHKFRRDSSTRLLTHSRYAEDFTEEGVLGKGAFGEVVKARKKLDGQFYAIKKVTLKSRTSLTATLKEVRLLSRISHPAVVRYYNTWVEGVKDTDMSVSEDDEYLSGDESESEVSNIDEEDENDVTDSFEIKFEASASGLDFISNDANVLFTEDPFDRSEDETESQLEDDSEDDTEADDETDTENAIDSDSDSEGTSNAARTMPIRIPHRNNSMALRNTPVGPKQHTVLYISMEYCDQRTLRNNILRGMHNDPNEVWRLFRQILEGLAHIHALRIVHRDLKPENIFISQGENGQDNIKIGDFGLATSGHFVIDKDKRGLSDSQTLADMGTKSIGTAFYAAPEVRSESRGYSSKVDMYSLGLIFFEMCTTPCESVSERIHVSAPLRESPPKLPEAAENRPVNNIMSEIILSLLVHEPEIRPSSAELLKSGKLPVQFEGETIKRALAGIADPHSPYYSQILRTIFSRPPEAIKDYTWASSMNARLPDAHEGVALSESRKTIVNVFERHGAYEFDRGELYPRSRDFYPDEPAVFTMLDTSGTLLQLPFDLTLGFARILATCPGHVPSRSYSFGSVYRSHGSGPPDIAHEVDFDIVSTDMEGHALQDAEAIKVLDEVVQAFPGLATGKLRLVIGHSLLLHYVFETCKVKMASRRAAAQILSKLNIHGQTFSKLRAALRAPQVGVSATSLDALAKYDWTDLPNKGLARIRSLLDGTPHFAQVQPAFLHMAKVFEYCKHMGVITNMYLNPLVSIKDDFYTNGLIFALIREDGSKEVLAAGGRYDSLISAHRPPGNTSVPERYSVGFSLNWQTIARAPQTQRRLTKKQQKAAQVEGTADIRRTNPVRVEVLVAATSKTMRPTSLQIVSDLWANGYSAEPVPYRWSPEGLRTRYRDDDAAWLVIVKPDALKIKSIWRKDVSENEVSRDQLFSHLRNERRERESAMSLHTRSLSTAVAAADDFAEAGRRKSDQKVKIFVGQTRSKKFNRHHVIEQAHAAASSLMSSFLGGSILALETADSTLQTLSNIPLSDSEGWRHAIQRAPLAEREYMWEMHEELLSWQAKWRANEGSQHAFMFNFRTGLVVYIDLSR